jgi:hypothetical protein
MKCNDCGIEMVEGDVMIPVFGSRTGVVTRGVAIYPKTAALGKGTKCPGCGHTVGPRLLQRDAREETLEEMGR